jgi:hypothetical protein
MGDGIALKTQRLREIPSERIITKAGWQLEGDADGLLYGTDVLGGGLTLESDGDDNDEAWCQYGGEMFSFRSGTRIGWFGTYTHTEANTDDKNFALGFGEFQANMISDADAFISSIDGFGFYKLSGGLGLNTYFSDATTQDLDTGVFTLVAGQSYRWAIQAFCKGAGAVNEIKFYWDDDDDDGINTNWFERATAVNTYTAKDLDALNLMAAGVYIKNGGANAETMVFGGHTPYMVG